MRTTSDKRGDGEGASKNERLDHGGAGRWRSEEERYGIGGEAERRVLDAGVSRADVCGSIDKGRRDGRDLRWDGGNKDKGSLH